MPVPLNRALSKLGILSRARGTEAIRAGRVRVDGRVVVDPLRPVEPERVAISLDGEDRSAAPWRTLLFHKPRGVVTTTRDPAGRRTVFDLVDDPRGLIAVGRLDLATSGLLLLTTDTQLANWITDPANAVRRVYTVTVRGRLDADAVRRIAEGVRTRGETLHADEVSIRKASGRETHLIVVLREGKNREVRRLFEAVGHEVTRLKRIALGGLELGDLEPGRSRPLSRAEAKRAFPGAPLDAAPARGSPRR